MLKIFNYITLLIGISLSSIRTFHTSKVLQCGPYGFICDGANRVRLCDEYNLGGPTFICPQDSICNQESTDVCENSRNYIDPSLIKSVRCHRNERIADPSVSDCKGYILCIPNKNRFQGIKFKCSGNTIFNGFTRTCTAPEKYKCPILNTTKHLQYFKGDIFNGGNVAIDNNIKHNGYRPIDCKNYKFAVTQDAPTRPTYFCPSRPVAGESRIRCTIFSNYFCITLDRDYEDQFIENSGAAFRKPRLFSPNNLNR